MPELRDTEVDPLTGETRKWWFDGDKLVRTREIDLAPDVSVLKNEAKMNPGFRMDKPMQKVASIPMIIVEKLMKDHDLDVFSENPSEIRRLEQLIEINYPFLKTTEKKLWRPS
jgi:hypothetical protein